MTSNNFSTIIASTKTFHPKIKVVRHGVIKSYLFAWLNIAHSDKCNPPPHSAIWFTGVIKIKSAIHSICVWFGRTKIQILFNLKTMIADIFIYGFLDRVGFYHFTLKHNYNFSFLNKFLGEQPLTFCSSIAHFDFWIHPRGHMFLTIFRKKFSFPKIKMQFEPIFLQVLWQFLPLEKRRQFQVFLWRHSTQNSQSEYKCIL